MDITKKKSGMATVLTVALGTFMCSFDANAVNMALPLMQRFFDSSISLVVWVAVAYLLALSASLLAFGRLADMWGHKRLYVAGFVGFTASSLFSALSPTIAALIVSRILQGLSASFMMASANALIVGAVSPSRRGRALGMTAVAVALASCAGPALGGLLATAYGWKSIFLVNLPIGIVGTFLSVRTIGRDGRARTHPIRRHRSRSDRRGTRIHPRIPRLGERRHRGLGNRVDPSPGGSPPGDCLHLCRAPRKEPASPPASLRQPGLCRGQSRRCPVLPFPFHHGLSRALFPARAPRSLAERVGSHDAADVSGPHDCRAAQRRSLGQVRQPLAQLRRDAARGIWGRASSAASPAPRPCG